MRSFVFAILSILIIGAQVSAQSISAETEPVITFDKPEYGPFDFVRIKIVYTPANIDPTEIDHISAKISTLSGVSRVLKFGETNGTDTGIFSAGTSLTPDPELWWGEMKVQRDDDLIVEFETEGMVFTKRVDVNLYKSGLRINKDFFTTKDEMEVWVWDLDMNRRPHTIDTLQVRVWSTTDTGGINLVLREINANSGIFHEIVTFTTDETSTGTRLRVSDGDTVTVKYTDKTLPPPAKLSSNGFETVEVEELFASAVIADRRGPPTARVNISVPQIFKFADETRTASAEFTIGDQLVIETEISNMQNNSQKFVYFIQIKDSDNVTVSLSWVTGELKPNQLMKIERNWIPESLGKYTIENTAWKSIENPAALSLIRIIEVEIK